MVELFNKGLGVTIRVSAETAKKIGSGWVPAEVEPVEFESLVDTGEPVADIGPKPETNQESKETTTKANAPK